MPGTEVAGMSSLQEKIAERIRASFVDLVPEDVWADMVRKELDAFTKNVLPQLVRDEAKKRMGELLVAEFKKPEWQEQWRDGGLHATPLVRKIVAEAAPELVSALFQGIVGNIIMNLRNNSPRVF